MPEKHQMIVNGRAESGAEEWLCPRCGRRVLLRWPPGYERLVLEHGDVAAIHIGTKGGIRVGDIRVGPAPATGDEQWLRDNGIDWDGTPA